MPNDALLLLVCNGRMSGADGRRIRAAFDTLTKGSSQFDLFGDGWAQRSYEPGYRIELSAWVAANRSRIRAVHIVVSESKVMRLGASILDLILPGVVRLHHDPASFELDLQLLGGTHALREPSAHRRSG
jgi:hypothetical protein